MTNPSKRHIIFVIDRSGSIREILSDMQGGYDQFVTDQLVTDKQESLVTTASLYQFDTEHDQLFSFAPLAGLKDYRIVPRGGTALLDALGTAIVKEGEKLAALPEDERPGTVIVLCATDGKENSSHEYSKAQLGEMLTEQQEKYGWVIIYNGANQDSFAEAGDMGIAVAAVMDWNATPEGTQGSWDSASSMVSRGASSKSYEYTPEERAARPEVSTPPIDEATAVRALLAVVDQYVRDNTSPYKPLSEQQLPEGLRLEIHPSVRYMLYRNFTDDFTRFMAEPLDRIPVPVEITMKLPYYGWRLVIVTEDVINGGIMPHESTEPQPKEP